MAGETGGGAVDHPFVRSIIGEDGLGEGIAMPTHLIKDHPGREGGGEQVMNARDRRVWYVVAAVAVIVVLLLIAWAAGWFEAAPPVAPPPEAPPAEVQPEAPPQ